MTASRAPVALAVLATTLLAAAGCAGAGRPTLSDDTLPPRACSAEGMEVEADAEGLPPPVTRTRQAVIDAAVACDYETLGRIAAIGGLEVTIDGEEVPVPTWSAREEEGRPVLSFLVGILGLPPADETTGPPGSVTWPPAVDWPFADVAPPAERRALVQVVGEDGVFGWAETGGYAGWRTTIAGDGRWRALLLGPAPDDGPGAG